MFANSFSKAVLGVAGVSAMVALCSCDGSKGGAAGLGQTGNPTLLRVEYGRLVDIYAYRRIELTKPDRRDTLNRVPQLIARDVVVGPEIATEDLFDGVGAVRASANFRMLPFDVVTGHDELLILWDDREDSGESARFEAALERATTSLVEVAAANRDQNIAVQPIPVVPRNAALKLTFDRPLNASAEFFASNPGAIQLLRFRDDPNTVPAVSAFEVVPTRLIANGASVTIDTTLIGNEANGRFSTGLAPSEDSQTANFRIAIPTGGVVSRQLRVQVDPIESLNGVDSQGDRAVIRDFRSGNRGDGRVGALGDSEAPNIVTSKSMGILAVDRATRTLTINKRANLLALRGRIPFVDGAINANVGFPGGPPNLPTINETGNPLGLPSGDFVYQDVVSASGETVRIRAEILENLDVGSVAGDADYPAPGLTTRGTDGGEMPVTRVRVSTVSAVDSRGNRVEFQASDLPLGQDCRVGVRYYEFVRYDSRLGGFHVSDSSPPGDLPSRRGAFLLLDPVPPELDANGNPIQNGDRVVAVAPNASISMQFSEPLDIANVQPLDNFVLTTREVHAGLFQRVLAEPKSASLTFLATRLRDKNGDGTLLELVLPFGHYHVQGARETHWIHVDLARVGGVRDLSGNIVDIFDRRPAGVIQVGGVDVDVPLENFSVEYELAPEAASNFVGSRVFRFAAGDEDGTVPGSLDFFGQFQLGDGRLAAAQTNRRSLTADDQNLGSIQRWDKGECVAAATMMPPAPPVSTPPPGPPFRSFGPGSLYWTPSMVAVQPVPPLVFQPPQGPQQFGGIIEPHTKRGSRLQMTYREDDFDLSYHNPNDLNLDVEQLHWSRWINGTILFDRFDRYTMALSHSRKRPDLLFTWGAPPMADPSCWLDCMSLFSGLNTTFAENPLPTGTRVEVVKDAEYVVNPNQAFQAPTGNNYIPYPKFERTYTWRDSRQVSWDMATDAATGLGGALNADSDPSSGGDRTASVSSPWIRDDPQTAFITEWDGWVFTQLVRDQADFLGDRSLDHDPIALPLLVDVSVWPDDTQQTSISANLFHIAYVGPIWTPINPGGYYNSGGGITTSVPFPCTNIDWPFFRVHTSGGVDQNNGTLILIDPEQQDVARGGVIKDIGLGHPVTGLYATKPGDDHLQWAQIDMLRKVSLVTFGFFDTQRPNQHALAALQPPLPALPPAVGRPDFTAVAGGTLQLRELTAVLDPPINSQPGGTKLDLEFRGVSVLPNSDGLYNPSTRAGDLYDSRKNLLNPNYACDAYRYAMPNPGAVGSGPRIQAEGFTPYVIEDELDSIRDTTGMLPRYINVRLVMENNVESSPPVSPSLRSMALIYRMAAPQ